MSATPPADDVTSDAPALAQYLLEQSKRCTRLPRDRFRHPWLAPMPEVAPAPIASTASGRQDGFVSGNYSGGLFHHDASESAIELLRYPELREAAAGSLLCLLDNGEANGCIYRSLLPRKTRDPEPAKPVLAQFAQRIGAALGPEWLEQNQVYPRIARFLRFYEEQYLGLHGLFVTHSSMQSGFDSDLLTAGLPERSVEGPDTNAFMVLEYEAASALAHRLGHASDAGAFGEAAERLKESMRRLLWYEDDAGGFFAALHWRHRSSSPEDELVGISDGRNAFRPLESWTCLLPLYAGIPTRDQARAMIRRILDPQAYWGPYGIRTLPANSFFFNQAPRVMLSAPGRERGPVSNWSGPIWILSNYYLASGLKRFGFDQEARELSLKTARLLVGALKTDGALRECYNDRGGGLWPQRGTFISWNVLALTMLRDFAGIET